jgi:large conductance mechanosensitive channel
VDDQLFQKFLTENGRILNAVMALLLLYCAVSLFVQRPARLTPGRSLLSCHGNNGALPQGKGGPMLREFRDFAIKGNVIDLAVGIVIGAAFGKIVNSLVNDIIMPPIGKGLGNVDFSNMFIDLSGQHYASLAEAKKAGAATINYGLFINTCLEFLVVAFAVFLLVQQINRIKRAPAPPEPDTKECPQCLATVPLKAVKCRYCTSELKQ